MLALHRVCEGQPQLAANNSMNLSNVSRSPLGKPVTVNVSTARASDMIPACRPKLAAEGKEWLVSLRQNSLDNMTITDDWCLFAALHYCLLSALAFAV